MRTKKGFTLMELIIVIAIIGILLAVLIPSWGYYLQRAHTRTQNNKAKAIFNAAQTVVTDMNFAERKYIDAYNNETNPDTKLTYLPGIYSHIPGEDNEFYYYWDGTKGYRIEANGDNYASKHGEDNHSKLALAEWDKEIGDAIEQIVDDRMVYKIYVKDYIVQSVASARFASDRYIGTYPINLDKAEENGVNVDDVKKKKVIKANMKLFDLDPSNDT